jgi:hypothetical protein
MFAPIPIHPANFRFCRFFFISATLLHWCTLVSSTNISVHYNENQNVSRTPHLFGQMSPIFFFFFFFNRLAWRGNGNTCFQDGGHFRDKRMGIQCELRTEQLTSSRPPNFSFVPVYKKEMISTPYTKIQTKKYMKYTVKEV